MRKVTAADLITQLDRAETTGIISREEYKKLFSDMGTTLDTLNNDNPSEPCSYVGINAIEITCSNSGDVQITKRSSWDSYTKRYKESYSDYYNYAPIEPKDQYEHTRPAREKYVEHYNENE